MNKKKVLKMPSWLFTTLCIITAYTFMIGVGLWVWLAHGKLELK